MSLPFFILLFVLFLKSVEAYIDPGTGGLVISSGLSAAWAFLAALFLVVLRPVRRFLRRGWKWLMALALLAGIIIYLSSLDSPVAVAPKVLLIGIDGTPPRVVEELMADGKLPNFVRLKERGGYARLQATIPPESPVAWSAIATGNNPGRFGIFDFIEREEGDYLPTFSLLKQTTRQGKTYERARGGAAFWEITSKQKIPTTIIRWPVTFPVEKIHGRMLAGLGFPDIRGFLNSYTFYTARGYNPAAEGAEKIIQVDDTPVIQTVIRGPKTEEGLAEVPVEIKKHEGGVTLRIQEREYEVAEKGWSGWIRLTFDLGLFSSVQGIAKAYVASVDPFQMYLTSVQVDPEKPLLEFTSPASYSRELAEEMGVFYTMGMPEDTKAVNEGRLSKAAFVEQVRQIEEERRKMFWHEFEKFDAGVFAFVFDSSDRLMHLFWEKEKIAPEIVSYYQEMDAFLGEVLDRMDDRTVLMVFSDHGFTSFDRAVSINRWLIEHGVMAVDPQKPRELFESVDWGRTQAYAVGFASLYLNMEGRERKGIVKRGEKGKVVDNLILKLGELEDPKTGKKVVTELYKREEIYEGSYLEEAPDLIIGFNEGYRMAWQDAIGGYADEVLMDNTKEWKGDHLMDPSHVPGVLFTSFKLETDAPAMVDLAPTVLAILGLEAPMDGKSLVG